MHTHIYTFIHTHAQYNQTHTFSHACTQPSETPSLLRRGFVLGVQHVPQAVGRKPCIRLEYGRPYWAGDHVTPLLMTTEEVVRVRLGQGGWLWVVTGRGTAPLHLWSPLSRAPNPSPALALFIPGLKLLLLGSLRPAC